VHDRLNGEGAFEGLDLSARITMLRTVAHLLDAQPTMRIAVPAGERAPAQPAPTTLDLNPTKSIGGPEALRAAQPARAAAERLDDLLHEAAIAATPSTKPPPFVGYHGCCGRRLDLGHKPDCPSTEPTPAEPGTTTKET